MVANPKVLTSVYTLRSTARTLKAQAAYEGLNASELAEAIFLHYLSDEKLLAQLIAECHAAKQAAKAAA